MVTYSFILHEPSTQLRLGLSPPVKFPSGILLIYNPHYLAGGID